MKIGDSNPGHPLVGGAVPLPVRRLRGWGFEVFPAGFKGKTPLVPWREVSGDEVDWGKYTKSNYWVATGSRSGVLVLDCDNDQTDRWWREVAGLAEQMDATASSRTAKGAHYWFRLEPGEEVRGWAAHQGDLHFDVRGDGGGVIAPPSVHETGHQYAWIRSPDQAPLLPLPDALRGRDEARSASGVSAGGLGPETSEEPTEALGGGSVRSMISQLLANPAPEGGRNDWMAKVCGHLAVRFKDAKDAYDEMVAWMNRGLAAPLGEEELVKTRDSIWQSERAKATASFEADSGWLASRGNYMVTQARIGSGENKTLVQAPCSSFGLKAVGIVHSAAEGDIYDLEITRKDGEVYREAWPARSITNPIQFKRELGTHSLVFWRPDGLTPEETPMPERLVLWLNAQKPPRMEMAEHLGWDDRAGGFVTIDGLITNRGQEEWRNVRPNPRIGADVIPYRWGFAADAAEARRVLAEVLTFQQEEVASVFGAWWAACLLKPQLQKLASLFPLMAIEASSGVGKTNGFFGMMTQLNGNTSKPKQATLAAFRDYLKVSQSGIVWIDDMDEVGKYGEVLRAATGDGEVIKKGEDRTHQAVAKLVAPILLSGEHLGLSDQKAMLDRSIVLNPGKASDRQSTRGDHAQWQDIVELAATYPKGLADLAGWYVQSALILAPQLTEVYRRMEARVRQMEDRSSRMREKLTILAVGAWLLDRLVRPETGPSVTGDHEMRVWAWIEGDESTGGSAGDWDNALTLEILPAAMRKMDRLRNPFQHQPVWVDDRQENLIDGPVVWVSTTLLADWWREDQHGRGQKRTSTAQALRQQMDKLPNLIPSTQHNVGRVNRRYRGVTGPVAALLLARYEEE